MNRSWLTLASVILLSQAVAQPIKEQFDHIAYKTVFTNSSGNSNSYDGLVPYLFDNSVSNPWSGYQYGEQLGFILEGYIRMYETTRDKAYLIKFVNLAVRAVAWRKENKRFSNVIVTYMDGLLLWPVAHFIHLIEYDEPDLASFTVSSELIPHLSSTIPGNELPLQASYGMGMLADWLFVKCDETLQVCIETWTADKAFDVAVNLNGGFAGAFLYLGHLSTVSSEYSGSADYLDKGALQARLFKNELPFEDKCTCGSFNDNVLYLKSNNSYTWYHAGWHVPTRNCRWMSGCSGPGIVADSPWKEDYERYVEDISHAVVSMIIPTTAYKINLFTAGGYPFSTAEMVRFRNTFTKNIWDPVLLGFHNSVNGTDAPVYPSSADGQFNNFKYGSLAWMPLQVFDGGPGAALGANVYDVIKNFYMAEVFPYPTEISGGLYYLGVADVVAAQWEKECFSLSLFNRNLVYDQDFVAKAVLTVDPNGEAGASFADPVIQHPHFTVQPNISSTFRAGAAVIMEPGFEASLGSIVELTIDPLGCGLAYKSRKHEEEFPERMVVEEKVTEPVAEELSTAMEPLIESIYEGVVLSPNPAGGELFVQFTTAQVRRVSVKIWDGTGRVVLTHNAGLQDAGQGRIEVGVGKLARGIYSCEVVLDNTPKVYKLVLE